MYAIRDERARRVPIPPNAIASASAEGPGTEETRNPNEYVCGSLASSSMIQSAYVPAASGPLNPMDPGEMAMSGRMSAPMVEDPKCAHPRSGVLMSVQFAGIVI